MAEPDRVCSRCGARYDGGVIFCPSDGTPLGAKKLKVGEDAYLGLTIGDDLRIEQLIGIGAMGRVYRAHQLGVARDVAIKILHRDLLDSPSVVARFEREARIASRLAHPNVVQMLTTGRLPPVNAEVGGEAYLVMEHLDGISLRSALAASGGAMPLPRALHVVLQASDATGEAHAQGIVHRDIKPENVMLVKRGEDPDFVKVLDFGVARIERSDTSIATQAGAIFGTARYVSPEGAQGKTVTPESDVYSLAVLLFECLAGRTPFEDDSPVAILIKHTKEPPPDVRSVPRASYVPEPLARVIGKNLAKNPSDRARDARALGRELVLAASESGLSPDDLVMRSTLLGGAGRALSLRSIEQTKVLPVGADAVGSGEPPAEAPSAVVSESALRPAEPDDDAVEPRLAIPGASVSPVKWLLVVCALGVAVALLALGGRWL
ncbi:MAG: serine/threonine protein kinase [Myxococcales bacterium]|nr:serine/threonine protein kinase [Myxococcales bacterium]